MIWNECAQLTHRKKALIQTGTGQIRNQKCSRKRIIDYVNTKFVKCQKQTETLINFSDTLEGYKTKYHVLSNMVIHA